jgi:Cys-tRNA synthase (O-phospho-L-seryl-tRNA:Cys-tRNA synthase)
MTKIVPEASKQSSLLLAEVERRVLKTEAAVARQRRFIEAFEHFGPFHALGEACQRLEAMQGDLEAHRATQRMLREPRRDGTFIPPSPPGPSAR